MRKGWIFVFVALFMLYFYFNSGDVDAAACGNGICEAGESPTICGEDCKCGNGICEAGDGELELCIDDCEGQTISNPGEDCRAGPCTSVDSTSRCSGSTCDCIFSVSSGCFTCSKTSGNLWYSAWGDYACWLDAGQPPLPNALSCGGYSAVSSFYVNSCDGSEECCGSGQSSCIKADECGQRANDGLIKAKGADGVLNTADDWFYGGGTKGVCRENCNTINACRTQSNGQAQRCVSCSYRPDTTLAAERPGSTIWDVTNVAKSGVWIDDPSCVAVVNLNCDINDNNCLKSSGSFNCPSESKDSLITLTYSGGAAKPVVSKLTTNDVNAPTQRQCSSFDAVSGECKDSFPAQGVNGFTLDTDLKVAGYSGAANTLVGNCNFYFGCPLGQKWDYTQKACVDEIKNCVTQLNGNCGSFDAGTSIEVTNKNNCVLPEKCLQCKSGFVWNNDLKRCVAPCVSASTTSTGLIPAGSQGGCTTLNLAASDVANDLIATANECQNAQKCVACKAGYVWKGIESSTKGCLPACSGQEQSCTSNANCCQFNADNPPKELYCSRGIDGTAATGSCCPKGQYYDPLTGCTNPDVCDLLCSIYARLNNQPNADYFSSVNYDRCVQFLPKPFDEACVINANLGISAKVFAPIRVLDANKNRVTPAI